MVLDGCTMFNCQHEFVAYPFGFVCHKCEHQRPELELKGDKRLIFFPLPLTGAPTEPAYLQASQ